MLPRSRSGAKKAFTLLKRSVSSSKHSLKQSKEGSSGYVRSQPEVVLPPGVKATPAAMPKPPSAPPSATGASPSSSSSSSWQFHPSIPIDVRLLGAGALGTGALLYSLSGGDGGDGKKKSNGETKPEEENVFIIQDDDGSNNTSEQNELSSSSSSDSLPSSSTTTIAEEGKNEQEEEPAILVDSHEVLKMIEDVLSKPAEQMLSEDAAALSSHNTPPTIKDTDKKIEGEKKQEEVQAAQVAITTAMAETAAESISSDIVKASKGVDAMNPATSSKKHHHPHLAAENATAVVVPHMKLETTPTTPTIISDSLASASATLSGIDPDVLNILGLHADLTAAGLLADAAKSGSGPGDNWEEYAYRHKQAESDAEVLGSLLDAAAKNVKKQLEAAQTAAIAGHEEAEEARKEAAAQAERFHSALADALKKAEEGHRVQMNQQAEKLANAHAEMTVRERVERQQIVDDLRKKLSALERALEKRGDAARGSTTVHRIAQGAFALQETLDKGGKVDQAVDYLLSACGSDPLITAAVRALPRGKRISTPVQLTEEFTAVEKVAKELSLLPAGHGGMLSAAVAKLVSKLKLKETTVISSSDGLSGSSRGGGIDAKLGQVEAEVIHGRYTQAARKLEEAVQGTAAEVAVKDWVEAARARAAAEQAVAVVEAHAATATLSLA